MKVIDEGWLSKSTLRKHAYSNILKIFFSDKNSDNFHISAQNNVYPCKPQFHYIKVGFEGSKLYRHVFVMIALIQNPSTLHFSSFMRV